MNSARNPSSLTAHQTKQGAPLNVPVAFHTGGMLPRAVDARAPGCGPRDGACHEQNHARGILAPCCVPQASPAARGCSGRVGGMECPCTTARTRLHLQGLSRCSEACARLSPPVCSRFPAAKCARDLEPGVLCPESHSHSPPWELQLNSVETSGPLHPPTKILGQSESKIRRHFGETGR